MAPTDLVIINNEHLKEETTRMSVVLTASCMGPHSNELECVAGLATPLAAVANEVQCPPPSPHHPHITPTHHSATHPPTHHPLAARQVGLEARLVLVRAARVAAALAFLAHGAQPTSAQQQGDEPFWWWSML